MAIQCGCKYMVKDQVPTQYRCKYTVKDQVQLTNGSVGVCT